MKKIYCRCLNLKAHNTWLEKGCLCWEEGHFLISEVITVDGKIGIVEILNINFDQEELNYNNPECIYRLVIKC